MTVRSLTDFPGLRRTFWPVIPVLYRRDVGHAPLVSVPAVKAIHLEGPEAGSEVTDHDDAIGIADIHAESTRHHIPLDFGGGAPKSLRIVHATPTGLVGAVEGVRVSHRVRIG